MKTYLPLPWTFEAIERDTTGETWGQINAANGRMVAEAVYQKDAEAILAAVSMTEELTKLRALNGKRPCDCTSCDCGNSGDAYSAGSWDGTDWALNALTTAAVEKP